MNFTYKELTHSDTAKRNGIKNIPPTDLMDNFMMLVYMIQRVREVLGVPMKVNSGYRNPQVNKLVGGAKQSKHMQFLALDFKPIGMSIEEAYNKIAQSDVMFDKLILEKNSKGAVWIHIQITKKPRRLFFKLNVK